jgi:hypothetical protein
MRRSTIDTLLLRKKSIVAAATVTLPSRGPIRPTAASA